MENDLHHAIQKITTEVTDARLALARLEEKLDAVHEQTKKTNGRVNGHDTRLDKIDDKVSYATGAVAVGLIIVMPLLVYIFNKLI